VRFVLIVDPHKYNLSLTVGIERRKQLWNKLQKSEVVTTTISLDKLITTISPHRTTCAGFTLTLCDGLLI